MTEEIYLLIIAICALLILYFFIKNKNSANAEKQLKNQVQIYFAEKTQAEKLQALAEEKYKLLQNDATQKYEQLQQQQTRVEQLQQQNSRLDAELGQIQRAYTEQKNNADQLYEQFSLSFERVANQLLEDKSQKFTQLNREQMGHLLQPLAERIKHFEEKILQTNLDETRRHASLLEQIKQLSDLNKQMSTEAQNLSAALKGDSRVQGNWGEMILESILEKSGLVNNREYTIQSNFTNENAQRQRPDVIIHLPENRHLIIDAKVSLTAYERSTNHSNPADAAADIKAHVASLHQHITRLAAKQYQQIYQLQSLDFILLFVPIEAAFSVAVQHDPNLFNKAFEQNIVIVSPTTLLATMRTIANIWRQEQLTQNAIEIARKGGELYDKMAAFVEDMEKIGKQLDTTQNTYQTAMRKLSMGKGNILRKAETLRLLGARNSKKIPNHLISGDDENTDDE
ncbi:MAG: DNA recombination protein RmuC [Chitinophagales bacterium]|nr:DNA recombination protein RmuC [Bacteroidota bacterium]MCB9043514.1 DNA recombination protein RmuC [Chitinophagales bacterium]